MPHDVIAQPTRWWVLRGDGRIECQLCPRRCKLADGQRGYCFVRQRIGTELELTTFGHASGFCVDPIEKKPLHHFLPGTAALSFGTIGCNLGCRFCQNWDITKAQSLDLAGEAASPDQVAATAVRLGCHSVAFTYNDPVIFAEYAIAVAAACHARDVKTVAVTAGYISSSAREEFFAAMDAANVDLKAFTERFYRRLCAARLQPVLDTLRYVHRETPVWLEVTTLLIPGENDSAEEIDRMSDWYARELGADVPWHFSAYHPDFNLAAPPTPPQTVQRARQIALRKGIRHVYTGNIHYPAGETTWCPDCGAKLIERQGYRVIAAALNGNRCRRCGATLAGVFEVEIGSFTGEWGRVHLES